MQKTGLGMLIVDIVTFFVYRGEALCAQKLYEFQASFIGDECRVPFE
jgi:hypothetical protein